MNSRSHRFVVSIVLSAALALLAACGTQPPGGDTTPPSLLSASPPDGAVDVPLNAALVLGFSEPIGGLLVTPSPLTGMAATLWDESGQVATIAPSPAWPAGIALSFAVRAVDEAGNALELDIGFSTLDDDVPPAAPTGLVAVGREGAIDVSWAANPEPDLAGYLLFWGEDAAAPTGVVVLPATETDYAVTGLEDGVGYEVYLVAEDEAGNRSEPSSTVSATPGDTTPPALVSSQPADGVSGVGLVETVRFVFSEPMQPASLQVVLYEVQAPPEGDPIDPVAPVVLTLDASRLGPAVWNAAATTAQFDDVAPDLFESDKAYRFDLQAVDVAGNALPSPTSVSFLAGLVPDVIPPTVTTFEHSVDQDHGRAVIHFYFSEPMDQAATQAAFHSAPSLACAWTWPAAAVAVCTVNSGLLQLQSYAIQFTTGARDLMGNALETVWNRSFSTPNLSPRLTAYTPTSRFGLPVTVHDPYQPVTWTFNEPMQLASIAGEVRNGAGALVDTITAADAIELSVDGRTITYRPPAAYPCTGTIYTWTLTRVYEQGTAGQALRHTPVSYSDSFRCGDLGVGGQLDSDSQGD